eukprot:COSAG01_NODE_4414_length_5050_cov_27.191476_4_plen_178_part_00
MPSIIAVGFLSVLPSLSGSRNGGWAVGSIASLRDDPRLSALKDTTQMHDQMGHHAADGALALVLACVVPDLGRNDFFTSVRTCAHRLDRSASPSAISTRGPHAWSRITVTYYACWMGVMGVMGVFELCLLSDWVVGSRRQRLAAQARQIRKPIRGTHSTRRRGPSTPPRSFGDKRSH